ncbi:MAG: hypothetical protein GY847_41000 [Proteobacteria bacterium]|nr:hypothetical protein [Pseudomonadota bacterium]
MRTFSFIAAGVLAIAACQAPTSKQIGPDAGVCPTCPTCSDPRPLKVVVLGDRTGRPDDELFLAALEEAARLKPDLVISVGDLIDGYQPDERIEEAVSEWDHVLGMIRQTLGDVPLFSAAGNHDVWSEKSEILFERKLGHGVDFAFDAQQARVILFDSSRMRNETEISDDALDWLVRELYRSRDRAVRIVVTHAPLFAIGSGGSYGSPLHDVFIAGQADWVITGHWHHAMSDNRDGIRYRMIGPSGTLPHRPGHPESGNFQQLGFLTIDKNGAELSLIRVGAIVPSDAFPYDFNQLEWKIENTAIKVERFEFDPIRPRKGGIFHVVVTNVTDKPMKSELVFRNEPVGWRVNPGSRTIALEPGKSTRLRFGFTKGEHMRLFPGPRVNLVFPWPGGETYLLDTHIRPILAQRIRTVRKAPEVDGLLIDSAWTKTPQIGSLNRSKGPAIPGDTRVRVLRTKGSLYIGAEMDDPNLAGHSATKNVRDSYFEDEDHVLVFVDANPLDQKFLKIAVGVSGGMSIRSINTLDGAKKEIDSTGAQRAAVSRDKTGWSVELELSLSEIGVPPDSERIGFNFARGRVREPVISQAYWQPLLEHDQPSFGALVFP